MKIQVYKCPWTGKIFEFSKRDKYIKHLSEIRVKNREAWKGRHAKRTFSDWLASEKSRIKNVSEIPQWIMDNQEYMMNAYNGIHSKEFDGHFYTATDKFVGIRFGSIHYTDSASNSHNAPHTGVTNWGSKADLPVGYPGWVGSITGSLNRDKKHNHSYPYGSFLRMLGLKTGGGGGGNERWSYSVTVFLDDWPGLSHECAIIKADRAQKAYEHEQEQIVRRLKGYRY